MNLRETDYAYLLEVDQTASPIIGYTKTILKGDTAADMSKALAFTGLSFGVGCMRQVHGPAVKIIEASGAYECDGIFTKEAQLALVVRTADCLPLIFCSGREDVVGVVHMGWRSAKDGILDNIPYRLDSFSCVAGIGMRKCCYRVGAEFLRYGLLAEFVEERSGGFYFDPVGFARETLKTKGLREGDFFDLGKCSVCSGDSLYSYRRTKTTARTLSFIARYDKA